MSVCLSECGFQTLLDALLTQKVTVDIDFFVMTYQGRREQEADAEWRVVIGPICGNNKPISPIIKTRGHIFIIEPQIPKHRSLTHATFSHPPPRP